MKKIGYIGASFLLPMLAFAQTGVNDIYDVKTVILDIINNVLIPVLFALAFVVLLYGIFKYFVQGAGDEEKRASGQAMIVYGVIGLVLMFSIWGLVHILTGTVGLNNNVPEYPVVPQQ